MTPHAAENRYIQSNDSPAPALAARAEMLTSPTSQPLKPNRANFYDTASIIEPREPLLRCHHSDVAAVALLR